MERKSKGRLLWAQELLEDFDHLDFAYSERKTLEIW